MRKTTLRMKFKASALALVAAAMLPFHAAAAGLGKLTVLSVLGQPLHAELNITASSDELSSLSARVASPDAFKQAGIEYIPALLGIHLSLDKRANGQPFLSMSSDRPMNEPFLDLLVQLDWASGRLLREYTFLLDPPRSLLQKSTAAPAPVALPEVKPELTAPQELPAPRSQGVQAPSGVQAPRPAMRGSASTGASASGEAPQKPSALPRATSRMVKRGDTLNKIAGDTKPEGVSLDQMLVALFRSNKDAFEGGNMNRLMAGKILRIPDHEAAAAIDQGEARHVVLAQSADFNAYRRKLAAAVGAGRAAKEAAPKQAASGKITPMVEEKAALPAAGKDKLEISKSDASKNGRAAAGGAGAERLAAIEEDVVARDQALKEANARIAELEKNLSDLKKLVELKNQSMADLEKQAQTAKPATPTVPVPAAVSAAPAVPAAPVAPTASGALAVPAAPAAPTVSEATKPVPAVEKPVEKPAEAVAPVVAKPPPAPAAKKPAKPESNFIADNPEIVYGGSAIVALLLGYFAIWRRRRGAGMSDPPSRVSEVEASTNSVFGTTGGQSVDTSNSALHTDFSQSGMGTIDSDEGVDPVAEADVYMAYGRDAQAEEILVEALKADPTRHAVQLKLLEIYAAKKSIKQFEAVASELYGQTGGAGPDWAKAVPLIEKTDPENPLYGDKPAAAEPELEPEPAITPLAAPMKEGATQVMPGELEQIAHGGDTQPLGVPGIASPMPEDQPGSLDFDLDLGIAQSSVATPATEEEAGFSGMETLVIPGREAEAPSTESDEYLDLELQATDFGVQARSSSAGGEPLDGAAGDLERAPSVASGEASATAEDAAMIELERSDAMASKPLDFSFDFSSDAGDLPPPVSVPPVTSVDLSDIDLDLDETAPVASALPEPAAQFTAVPAAAAGPDSSGPDTAATEEAATKLELAHAYEEMGDKEGARELLQEVMQEGNAEQQASARAKLAELS